MAGQIEDKLSHDERLRLEALGQAIALNTISGRKEASQIIDQAREFAQYIRDAGS